MAVRGTVLRLSWTAQTRSTDCHTALLVQERKKQRLESGASAAGTAAGAATSPATPVAARRTLVLVHDLDETLLIFNSLLSGSWAAAHQLRGDPAAVAQVGAALCYSPCPLHADQGCACAEPCPACYANPSACWVLPALQLLQLGARWEAAILRLCDERFFFSEVRRRLCVAAPAGLLAAATCACFWTCFSSRRAIPGAKPRLLPSAAPPLLPSL